MFNEFEYAIETLMIEKHKLIALDRQIRINTHEARTAMFAKETEKTEKQLKQLGFAVAALERVAQDVRG